MFCRVLSHVHMTQPPPGLGDSSKSSTSPPQAPQPQQPSKMPPPLPTLSPAKAALLAASLASASDIPRLRRLVAARTLSDESLLQALLCLPETAPPESYSPLLLAILSRKPSGISAEDEALNIDTEALEKLSEKGARRKLRQVLPALPHASEATCEDLVTAFLTARAERIDSETGALSIVVELLLEFVELLPPVKELYGGTVEVLYRLVYEFSREPTPGLAEFRAMHVEEALEVLVVDPETVVRDLKELVEPYMAARDQGRKEWRHVWARLSALPFGKLIQVVNEWTPPDGVREDFAAWAVRICYHCTEMDNNKVWEGMHSVHRRIESLLDLEEGTVPETVGDLNDRQNPLFQPTRASLGLLDVIITSSALLKRPVSETVRLRLEGAADVQRAVLQQFVRAGNGGDWNKRDDEAWRKIRDGARWLRNKSEVFCQLSVEEVERAVLSGILAGTRFGLVRDIYVTGNSTSGLSLEDVEKCVLSAFNDFVDNASNGNKRRGSMKNALQAWVPTRGQHLASANQHQNPNTLPTYLHLPGAHPRQPLDIRPPRPEHIHPPSHALHPPPPSPDPHPSRPRLPDIQGPGLQHPLLPTPRRPRRDRAGPHPHPPQNRHGGKSARNVHRGGA